MAKFLVGNELSKTIKKICKGNDVCCAVAFWGDGATDLFTSESKPKIICNLLMGGTNPEALKNLGAPKADNIKHINGLHAKVYISDKGVVVASANASNNGIGFSNEDSKYGHIEAGSYSKANSKFWNGAKVWFEDQWKHAKTVEDIDLENASYRWSLRSPMPKTLPKESLTVIQALREEPAIFRDMKFVLANSSNDKDKTKIAREEYAQENDGRKPQGYSEFEDWELNENQWPLDFISISIGQRGAIYIKYLKSGRVYNDVQFAKHINIFKTKPHIGHFLDNSLQKNMRNLRHENDKAYKAILNEIINDLHEDEVMPILTANELSKLLKKYAPPKDI